jgi:SepF-like predicted cell division protein (DUF552 family)
LVNEAEKQVEYLLRTNLQILETDSRTTTYNEFDESENTIEQEQTIIVTQINQIKDLANAVNKIV